MNFAEFKILVVDDHSLLRHVVSNTLKKHGVLTFDWACDGNEALELIAAASAVHAPYDVMFLDWNMPNMNGFDVLTHCRADRTLDQMAIVMLTAESEAANIVQALKAGATAYITKPFQPETLVKQLEEVVTWRTKLAAAI